VMGGPRSRSRFTVAQPQAEREAAVEPSRPTKAACQTAALLCQEPTPCSAKAGDAVVHDVGEEQASVGRPVADEDAPEEAEQRCGGRCAAQSTPSGCTPRPAGWWRSRPGSAAGPAAPPAAEAFGPPPPKEAQVDALAGGSRLSSKG
jgi:hypothetical protein